MSSNHDAVFRGIVLGIAVAIGFAPLGRAQTLCGEWTPVDAPAGIQTLLDVTAASPNEAWALIGEEGSVHWDGTAWSEFPIPDLGGIGSPFSLRATTSLPPSHFFVAGIVVTSTWTTEQLLLTWDGSDWDNIASIELAPGIGGAPRYGSPSAIAAVAPDDLWIIGLATGSGDGTSGSPILTLYWDGSELTEHFTPGVGNRQNNMMDAVAIATDDMWAVGEYNNFGTGDASFHGMTYHYDGNSWSQVENPSQGIASTHLNAVAAIATDDVWAAGDLPDGPLFMHWDGNSWTIVPGPPGVTGTVHGLAAIATDDVWAVDTPWQLPTISKYYHWDGAEWSVVEPVIDGATRIARHGGLAAVGECDVWAVGNIDFGSGVGAFIERLGPEGTVAVPTLEPDIAFVEVSPNPMVGTTRIRSLVPGVSLDRAEIYDSRGRRVRTLLATSVSSGVLTWDGRDDVGEGVADGVYFLRVQTGEGDLFMQKLTVVR